MSQMTTRQSEEQVDVNKITALGMAVLHHGLSCMAPDVIPAKNGTVIQTAHLFEDYLRGER